MTSIPASQLVQVNPGVIDAGGSALDLSGVMLTPNAAVPIGTLLPFATADDVAAFFGPTSDEAALATVYFLGPDNSTKKPGSLSFWQYNTTAVGAYLRGGSLAGLTLTQLQALTPSTISLTVDGVVKTSTSVNLAGATSFSNAATLIQAAFTGVNCTYDAIRGAFVLASPTTGPTSTITAATASTMATGLKLTAAAGAVTSQGAAIATPGASMDALIVQSQNWATFMTLAEPVTADKVAFSAWTNGRNNRFAYVGWDTDANALVNGSSTTWVAQIKLANYSGSIPVWKSRDKAAFILSWGASLDFDQTNGRATLAFKHQTGLTPDVTNATDANNLTANGYNFYGVYATANDTFNGIQTGTVTGPFQWADTYLNEIWLNNGLQLALMSLLFAINSIPYNNEGYALIESACLDPINAALNFGAIRTGVTLSASQIAQVNNAAGVPIDTVLSTRGWYLQIKDAAPIVRQARQSPPINFWYMDGGSVQRIEMSSIVLQ